MSTIEHGRHAAPGEGGRHRVPEPFAAASGDPLTAPVRLPRVPAPRPAHGVPVLRAHDDVDTVAIPAAALRPIPAPRAGHVTPPPLPPPGGTPPFPERARTASVPASAAGADPARAAAVGLAALLAVCLLADVATAFPVAAQNGADWSTLAAMMVPTLVLAAASVHLALAIHRRAPGVVGGAAVLAVVLVADALFSTALSAPGALTGMLAAGLAVLLAVRPGAPPIPPADRATAAAVLALWWLAGCLGAGWLLLVAAHEVDGAPAGGVAPGVLFLLLAAVGGYCAVALRSTGPGAAAAPWILAGAGLVELAALVAADPWGHHVVALLLLHVAAVAAALLAGGVVPAAALAPLADASRRVRALPVPWVAGVGAGLVILVGIVLGVSGAASSGGSSSSGPGATIIVTAVGVLALAAMCTPTMTLAWRGGLFLGALLAFWLAWSGRETLSDTESSFYWIVLAPAALVGCSVWGAISNHRTGATSSRPGWVGPGGPPPPRHTPVLVPPTARARARIRLEVDSALDPATLLDAVRRATAVRGNWFTVWGAHVEVGGSEPGTVGLGIRSTCAFRARVETRGGRTTLVVGGMDRWTKSRWYLDFFIPITPASVEGFRMYRLYLRTVAAEVAHRDPSARLRIGSPSGGPA